MKAKYKFGVIITLIVLLFGAILVSGCVSSGGDNVDNDSPIEGKWCAVIEQPKSDWERGGDGLYLHEKREVTLNFKGDGTVDEKDVMNFYTYNPSTGKDTVLGSPITNNFDESWHWKPVSVSEYALLWVVNDKVAGKLTISDDGNTLIFDSYGAFVLGHATVNPVKFTSVKQRKPLYDASTQTPTSTVDSWLVGHWVGEKRSEEIDTILDISADGTGSYEFNYKPKSFPLELLLEKLPEVIQIEFKNHGLDGYIERYGEYLKVTKNDDNKYIVDSKGFFISTDNGKEFNFEQGEYSEFGTITQISDNCIDFGGMVFEKVA